MAKQDMAENQDKGNDKCTIEDLYVGIFKVLFKRTQHIAEHSNAEPVMEEQIRQNVQLLIQLTEQLRKELEVY